MVGWLTAAPGEPAWPRGCHECTTHKEKDGTTLAGWLTEDGKIDGGVARCVMASVREGRRRWLGELRLTEGFLLDLLMREGSSW
jgi:hypothetical protein